MAQNAPADMIAILAATQTQNWPHSVSRMIAAAAPIVLEATADVSDDAGELPDDGTDAERDGGGCADDVDGESVDAAGPQCRQ